MFHLNIWSFINDYKLFGQNTALSDAKIIKQQFVFVILNGSRLNENIFEKHFNLIWLEWNKTLNDFSVNKISQDLVQ